MRSARGASTDPECNAQQRTERTARPARAPGRWQRCDSGHSRNGTQPHGMRSSLSYVLAFHPPLIRCTCVCVQALAQFISLLGQDLGRTLPSAALDAIFAYAY